MEPLIEIKDVDRAFYTERLAGFLPERIIDIHTHVWREQELPPGARPKGRTVTWPGRVARDNSFEDLLETYRLMLPGQRVTPLVFATVGGPEQLDEMNAYVAHGARAHGLPALLFTHPEWGAAELERRIKEGGFLGAKSYLSYAPDYLPTDEIRVFDFFPPHQLEVHDRLGSILMVHVPRRDRLRDPVNLGQLLHIEQRYPGIRLVVAHVGRAYCDHDVGNAFEVLAASKSLCFDFCANTNAGVFEQAIRCVGPKRILFGTDLPILRMRMRRVTRGDHYVNLVPKGLYGDVSADPNMGEVEGEEAEKLTFFLYEELDAFRRAAEATGLSAGDLEDVFFRNADEMIRGAAVSCRG